MCSNMPQKRPNRSRRKSPRRRKAPSRISVPLALEERERLQAVADSQQVPVSVAWVARLAIRQFLERTQHDEQLIFDFGGGRGGGRGQ